MALGQSLTAAPPKEEVQEALSAGRIPAVAFQNVVGSSPALRRAIHLGCRVANHPGTTVLIQGETGTGKELFARGIHYSSPNAAEPFVAINCSAIPEHLLESELFGHERGAFSGASAQKRGLLEFAGTGTVFLDEIGDMPQSMQPKLLRMLEEKRVRRVGGLKEVEISCRIIAATNRDMSDAVEEGHFRADLFYRLSAFTIELPPLRKRSGDVELLARYFCDVLSREHGGRSRRLSPEAVDTLRRYEWPGNVRELRNVVEGALIVCDGDRVGAEHLRIRPRTEASRGTARVAPPTSSNGAFPVAGEARPAEVVPTGAYGTPAGGAAPDGGHPNGTPPGAGPAHAPAADPDTAGFIRIPKDGMTMEEVERLLIEATLRITENNISQTARILGISRPTIVRKLDKYELRDTVSDNR